MAANTYYNTLFTPAVVARQHRNGSDGPYIEAAAAQRATPALSADAREFLAQRDSVYLASVSESGWPYVQHRGGPAGFIVDLGDDVVGWIDRTGNRQFVSAGNIDSDDRVAIIAVDYPNRQRLKLLGHAAYHDTPDPELLAAFPVVPGRIAGVVTVRVVAHDWNCPKFITPRFTLEQVEAITGPLIERVAELEQRLTTTQP